MEYLVSIFHLIQEGGIKLNGLSNCLNFRLPLFEEENFKHFGLVKAKENIMMNMEKKIFF